MASVRIRWRGVAKVAAITIVGLIVVRLLPGFLRAPEPPPLGADVGLPKAMPVTEVSRGRAAKPAIEASGRVPAPSSAARPREQRRRPSPQKSRPRPVRDAAASRAVIGSRRKRRTKRPAGVHAHRGKVPEPPSSTEEPVESTPPPPSEYVPPAAPEAVPEPSPGPSPAPPSTPGDGSQEFAPH
jgi:hypothetical protein